MCGLIVKSMQKTGEKIVKKMRKQTDENKEMGIQNRTRYVSDRRNANEFTLDGI